ncbi:2-hydroxy-6-oxo-6-phenylhexa-2,4-dienoate hydrolase [Mycena sanguinolenta]|uniref:2-hydroxy-6-oxo-6-phenylhexa-2,4-dienoate hydrolase n=1 Tax=Mycena sanguinolenta TaxID=230812 RepID=A0A8H7CJB6_9AGAR|nr:2-hydroxy-6-oxo-6-phenylhexa-2,4-dienoate hydrolase [Mycena sanguinolenta]
MAFMDVAPTGTPNNKTAILFHGNFFCGATWNETIHVLAQTGYRVIVPDHIGYCKSTKPVGYQFSLAQLATNARSLLDTLGIGNVTVMGHSFGGTVTFRYALMFPESIDEMVVVNAVGLEDYVAKGVPWITIETSYATSLASTFESVQAYENMTYYVGQWEDAYDVWVQMVIDVFYGTKRDDFCWNQAQIVDVVLNQPIAHEFANVQPRLLLMIGEKDTTAIGKTWAPPSVVATLANFTALGLDVSAQVPNCTLVFFPELGHTPQISDPVAFHAALIEWLTTGTTNSTIQS